MFHLRRSWAKLAPPIALMLYISIISTQAKDPVHILYLTDCTMYSDWQTVGMAFSFKNSGQSGHITRVMCCTDEEKAKYNKNMLELMPSHVAPSFAYNERTKDHYAAFNKPGAVLDFMSNGTPLADYMLVIDSDMLLRHPFLPDKYNMSRGKAISADYTYMIGCTNDLANRHIPDIPLRNDTLAGPMHRHCDMVGGYTFMHREDLTKVAPLWLSESEAVREDPEAWRLSGDQYVEKGGKPWISEMYGYSFACAKSGVWHTWDTQVMHYPTYTPTGIPKLMHYGLLFNVDNFSFDKHWHYQFNVSQCPPWDLTQTKDRKGGLFPHPPRPSTLKLKDQDQQYYRDLLSVETVATINAGLCDYHLNHCAPSQQLLEECKTALDIYKEVMRELRKVEARRGFVSSEGSVAAQAPSGPATVEMEVKLMELAKKLGVKGAEATGSHNTEQQQLSSGGRKLDIGQVEAEAKRKAQALAEAQQQQKAREEEELKKKALEEQQRKEKEELVRKQAAEEEARKALERKGAELRAEVEKRIKEGTLESSVQQIIGGRKEDTHHRLVTRCHRMALEMDEVQACLKAAGEGKSYTRQLLASAPDSTGAVHLQRDTSSKDAKGTKEPVEPGKDLQVARAVRPGLSRGVRVGPWEALGLWMLGIVVLVVFIPRWVGRIRRRSKIARHDD